jgi:hypothetical protein
MSRAYDGTLPTVVATPIFGKVYGRLAESLEQSPRNHLKSATILGCPHYNALITMPSLQYALYNVLRLQTDPLLCSGAVL